MHGEHGKGSETEATGIREIVDTDLFGSQENIKSSTAATDTDNQNKSSTAATDTDNQNLVDLGMFFL